MEFKRTYKTENMEKTCYYYVDNKRVSRERFSELIDVCKCKGLKYNSSYLFYKNNGRVKIGFHYS